MPYIAVLTLPMLAVHSGSSPQYSKGTYIPVFPNREQQSSWAGRIINTSDKVVTMGITPIANCIVGKYQMYVAVMAPFGIRRTRRDDSRKVYILFNPWVAGQFEISSFHLRVEYFMGFRPTLSRLSSDDDVFLDDEEERHECIMNELGIIYHGSFDDIAERNWNYGQVLKQN